MVTASSTPSATTRMPRLWARSMIERTITASSSTVAMQATNDRSALISVTGSCCR
jgi:hypothetical protein